MKNLGQDISSVADAHERSRPVKLSRERWEMLWRGGNHQSAPEGSIWLMDMLEIDGVIFLPAEYVPDRAQDHDPR